MCKIMFSDEGIAREAMAMAPSANPLYILLTLSIDGRI
jgi:hypothetical protein